MGRGRKKRKVAEEPEAGPIFREIPVDADAADLMKTFKHWADEEGRLDDLTVELQKLRESLKAVREDAEAARRSALHLARTGKALKRVECVEVVNEARGVVEIHRKDTGDILDTRALSNGELQALSLGPVAGEPNVFQQANAMIDEQRAGFDFDGTEPPPVVREAEAVQH